MQLGGPPRGAGADPRAGRQLTEGEPVAGDDRVARVLAGRDGGERDLVVRGGREVLERVHRHVDLAAEQRVAQGADEDADPAEGGQRRGRDVAVGGHLDQHHLAAEGGGQCVGDVAGLGAGEQGGAGAHAQRRGHDIPSTRVTASTASGSSAKSSASAAA